MNRTIQVGDEEFPAKWEICSRCRGEGHHGNPAFDGTTTEWWLEGDPDGDDLQAYIEGQFDVPCEDPDCENGKVLVADTDSMSDEQRKEWYQWSQEEAEYRQQVRMERMMGA